MTDDHSQHDNEAKQAMLETKRATGMTIPKLRKALDASNKSRIAFPAYKRGLLSNIPL
jgi:hypothetical protein